MSAESGSSAFDVRIGDEYNSSEARSTLRSIKPMGTNQIPASGDADLRNKMEPISSDCIIVTLFA